jgi:hypothetical protein
MKKTILIALALFLGGFNAFSNPIAPPKVISELYIVNDSTWYLELVFSSPYNNSIINFNGLSLSSSSGTCLFKTGIRIITDSIIVITNDSLQTPLYLHRNGDFISITGSTISDQITFGDFLNSQIAAPFAGQSIVNYNYSCLDGYSNPSSLYLLVKENNPSIGQNPFQPTVYMGTFTGVVYDKLHRPLSGIIVGDPNYYYGAPASLCLSYFHLAMTDSTGHFSVNEYSGRYYIAFFLSSTATFYDSIVNIEPNTINYFEFTIDSLNASIGTNSLNKEISTSCFPNPSNSGTTITFEIPLNHSIQKILIKIYDNSGEMVRIIPVNPEMNSTKYAVNWDGNSDSGRVSAGTYYYTIEIDGRKIASKKIIVN